MKIALLKLNYIQPFDNLYQTLFYKKYFVTKKTRSKTECVEDEYGIEHFILDFGK